MRRSLMVLLLTTIGWAAAAAPARAQTTSGDGADHVQAALDLTDKRIDQATALVGNSDNAQARHELEAAVDTQGRAKSAFAASQLRIASALTLEARGHADRAIAIVRGLPDPDRVLAQVERTREILDRARERIEECNNDRAHALIRVALAMQERAENSATNGRYLAALQLTMSARERAFRALRLCNLDENSKDSAERALQRTDDAIARAEDAVGERGGEAARSTLQKAVEQQSQARAEYGAGHEDAALRLTLAARENANRALRLVRPRR